MMILNLMLAIVWVALTGEVSTANFLGGYVIGFLALRVSGRGGPPDPYFARARNVLRLVWSFSVELVRSNIRVAVEVVTPPHTMRPGIIAVPLDTQSDAQTLLLSNMITLTPGTLTIDLDTEGNVLYVHDMYVEDADRSRRAVKEGFERRVREAFGA